MVRACTRSISPPYDPPGSRCQTRRQTTQPDQDDARESSWPTGLGGIIPGRRWVHTVLTGARALTFTLPVMPSNAFPNRASAFDFLSQVAKGAVKRTTLSRVTQAARVLGLTDRVDYASYGYHVGKGWEISCCQTLQSVCEALLWSFATAPVLPAEKARSLYRQTASGYRVAWDEPGESF
jgi:hypothetical protein